MAMDPTHEQAAEVYAVLVERMQRYEQLLADLREGRIDRPAFRRQAVTAGLVVERDGAWIFDLARTRWVYYDGVELLPVGQDPAKPARKVRPRSR